MKRNLGLFSILGTLFFLLRSSTLHAIQPASNIEDNNHGGTDWTISADTVIAGRQTNLGSFIINSGVTVKVYASTVSASPWGGRFGTVEIYASTIAINGTLSADGAGYLTGPGLGGSDTIAGGGGGYGGSGNASQGGSMGGGPYGTLGLKSSPPRRDSIDLGSAGGTNGSNGGLGGGAILLSAPSITLNSVTAIGQTSSSSSGIATGGSGSGGTILLDGDTIAVTGAIDCSAQSSAFNASNRGGAGGGGRVKVFYRRQSISSINVSQGALWRSGGTGAGSDGTVYFYQKPSIPSLLSPLNGNSTGQAFFTWTNSLIGSGTVVTYELQVATSSDFGSVIADTNPAAPAYISTQALTAGSTYYWRVRAYDLESYTGWTQIRSFVNTSSGQVSVPPAPIVNAGYDEVNGLGYYVRAHPDYGSNDPLTLLAIQNSVSGEYLQGNGLTGVTAVWKTKSDWESGFSTNTEGVLPAITTESYRVYAMVNNVVSTAPSGSSSDVTPPSAPGAPSVLQLSSGPLQISFSSASGASGYWIYYDTWSGAPLRQFMQIATMTAFQTSYTDNVSGSSPTVPTVSILSFSTGQAVLSWTASSISTGNPKFYRVSAVDTLNRPGQKSPVGTGAMLIIPAVASYQVFRNGVLLMATTGTYLADGNLSPGTAYQYAVAALSQEGLTGLQGQASVTTLSLSGSQAISVQTPASTPATTSPVNGTTASVPPPLGLDGSSASGGKIPQGQSVPVNSQVSVAFIRVLDPASIQNNFTLTELKDRNGSDLNTRVSGSVSISSGGKVALFTPSSALDKGSLYRVSIASAVSDSQGTSLGSVLVWDFRTVPDHMLQTVLNPVQGVKVVLNPGVFSQDAGVAVNLDPANNAQYSNRALISSALEKERQKGVAEGAPQHYPMPGLALEIVGVGSDGTVLQGHLDNSAVLVMSYPDTTGSGIVDGTNPPVQAKDLQFYFLNEDIGTFQKVPGCSVDLSQKTVTASVDHFSVYVLMAALPQDVSGTTLGPNPWNVSQDPLPLLLQNLPDQAQVDIYSVTGQKVTSLLAQGGTGILQWNGANDQGDPVASGVYILKIKGAGGSKKMKLTIIR